MKPNSIFVLVLALFSMIDGYLLSAISFVGRAGISLFYTEYSFLKTWWKGALLVFIVWLVLFIIQSMISNKASKTTAKIIEAISIVIAVAGLCLSYADFRNSISHRWLGERFHLGVYLFWVGWISIASYLLLAKKEQIVDKRLKVEDPQV